MTRPNFETMDTAQRAAWWLEEVGYDPIAEGWQESELLELCSTYYDASQGHEVKL